MKRMWLFWLVLMAAPVQADMLPWGGGGGGGTPAATPTPGGPPTGCSVVAGVLTCPEFVATNAEPDAAFASPNWKFVDDPSAGTEYFYFANGSIAAFSFRLITSTSSPNATGAGFELIDGVDAEADLKAMASTAPGDIPPFNTPSSTFLGNSSGTGAGGLNLVNAFGTGGVNFWTGDTLTKWWSVTNAGVLQSFGTTSNIQLIEVAAPSGVASNDILYADSTAHRLKVNANNGGAQTLAYLSEAAAYTVYQGSSNVTGPNTGSTSYLPVNGSVASNTTENNVGGAFWTLGTFSNMFCAISAAPGTGKSWTVTLRKNNSNTAVTCTISDAAFGCSDTSHSSTSDAAPGAGYDVAWAPSGTPSAGQGSCTIRYTAGAGS